MLGIGELRAEWIPMTTSIGCVRARLGGFPFLLEAQLGRASERLQLARLLSHFSESARYDAIGARLARGPPLTDSRRMPQSIHGGADGSPDRERPRLAAGLDRLRMLSRRERPATS